MHRLTQSRAESPMCGDRSVNEDIPISFTAILCAFASPREAIFGAAAIGQHRRLQQPHRNRQRRPAGRISAPFRILKAPAMSQFALHRGQ
jgi:hypothetical protein